MPEERPPVRDSLLVTLVRRASRRLEGLAEEGLRLRAWIVDTYERLMLLIGPSDTKLLIGVAATIGLLTGFMAFVLNGLIHLIFHIGLGGEPAELVRLGYLERWPVLVFPAIGGLIVGPFLKYIAPEAKGAGVAEVMYSIARLGGKIRGRVAFSKTFASAVTIGTGGSTGREGPIIQIGASIGSALAQMLRLPPSYVKTMAAAGAAAGISAAFNAPLGGMVFSMEVILGELVTQPFAMVVIASVVGATVSRALQGSSAYFEVPKYAMNHPAELLLYLILGVIAGVVATLFMKSLHRFEDEFERRVTVPEEWRPAVGGLLVGAIGFHVPHILGSGHSVVEAILHGHMLAATAAGLILVKILATSLTLGSGGSGGVLMPGLFLGALVGGTLGPAFKVIFPAVAEPGAFAMVGMAAMLAALIHAPLTAIIILFEMTHDYGVILPVMVASVSAVLVAKVIETHSIETFHLEKKGVSLKKNPETDFLREIPVSEVMSSKITTVSAEMEFDKFMKFLLRSKHSGFPVVDGDNHLVGLVTQQQLRDAYDHDNPPEAETPVSKVMHAKLPKIYADNSVYEAIRAMKSESLDRIPIVDRKDERKVVGMVTEADILTVYMKRLG